MQPETLFDDPETLADMDELPATKPCFDHYRQELAAFPPLTAEEEVEVARRARSGDAEALDRLVCANLRFVMSVAKKYQGRGLAMEDLVAEGNLGLLTAARKFDPERGYKFISYAVWWIRQAIQKVVAEQGHSVRIPLNQATQAGRLRLTRARLRRELERPASPEELACDTGLSLDVVRTLSGASTAPVRLGSNREEGELDLADGRSDTARPTLEAARSEIIARALQRLSPREAKMLRLRFGLDGEEHTLDEIGSIFGICRERARQVCQRALAKLRENAELALEAGHEPATPTLRMPRPRSTRRRRLAA